MMFDGYLSARRVVRDRVEPQFFAASPENPTTNLANPASWFLDWAHGGEPGAFGPAVTERTAMACSAVYRCVAILSGITASLPLKVYKRTKDGRDEEPDHPLADMFKVAPYQGRPMTAFTWREQWGVHEMLWGDHFSAVRYDGAGRVIGFESAMPWSEVYRVAGENIYRLIFVGDYGQERFEWLRQDDVIHIPGLGFNGVKGMSRVRFNARNSIALSKMLLEQIGRVHENASKPSGLATAAKGISDKGFERFVAQFTATNTGRANAGKVIFGDDGTKFTPFQMSPEDLNTIELMRFGVADISRFFGVPLHLLNETDKSTSWGSGLSEQTLAFLIYTLEPDLGRIEAEINYKQLDGGRVYYAEFDRDGLLAMDPLKASQIAQAEIGTGTLLINERRRQKNRPPVANGDQPLINSTNVPLSKIFEQGAQPRQDPIQDAPIAPDPDLGSNPGAAEGEV